MSDTYGDVTAEYMALRSGAGLVEPARSLVWAEGPDAVSFLDGLLSQDVVGIAPGGVARSFLLEPRGKLRALLWVLRGESRVGLAADPGIGTRVLEDLQRFRFRVDVELRQDERPAWELWGPGAAEVLARCGIPAPAGWVAEGSGVVAAVPCGPLDRYLVVGHPADTALGAGARRAGLLAADSVRIEAGEPVLGVDVDEGAIPQETGLVDEAVSFAKGCYLGQELVARIDARGGRVNRRLRGLVVRRNVLPPVGATVHGTEGELGAVSSVGESLELRAPVALAMLHRDGRIGDEVTVRWEGGESGATIRDLPLDDFSSA
jgi:folate-binding protein YgfZ